MITAERPVPERTVVSESLGQKTIIRKTIIQAEDQYQMNSNGEHQKVTLVSRKVS